MRDIDIAEDLEVHDKTGENVEHSILFFAENGQLFPIVGENNVVDGRVLGESELFKEEGLVEVSDRVEPDKTIFMTSDEHIPVGVDSRAGNIRTEKLHADLSLRCHRP